LVQRKDGNGMARLDAEIAALAEYLQPSSSENVAIARIVRQISEQFAGVVPSPPQLVGSRSTRTAFSSSGIDLMVPVGDEKSPASGQRALNPMSSKTFAGILQKVEAAVRQVPDYDEFRIVPAKSPTLVMTHKASTLPINIFCGNKLPSSDDYIKTSLAGTPSLQPLYMVLRAILESRNIFGWETASLGPYGLILLVASFLKQQDTQFQQKGLGEQLLAILDFYGSKINFRTTGVAAEPAEFFDFASVRHKYKALPSPRSDPVLVGQRALLRFKANARRKSNIPAAKHLCIQDPTNYLNDVGLQCTRTAELKKILSSASMGLQLAAKRWDGDGSILGQALQANFDEFRRIRTSLTV
jgi:DNA polymerase sigma